MAIPAVASNVTVPLLGLSDTAISGHLGSEAFLAAIAAGTAMFNVVFLLCTFLRMATTGLTAEAYGRGNQRDMASVLTRSSALAIFLGMMVIVFQRPLFEALEWLIAPQGESRALAEMYFRICVWGAPALLLTLCINGWFIGMQNTALTMAVSVTTNVMNIALSLWFVFCLHYGFQGVALGTVCANWFGAFLALVLLHRFARKRHMRLFVWNRGGTRRYFNVSSDLFLRSACILTVTLSLTSMGARMGELTLAVNAVMMQFFMFFTYFMDGYAYSAEALVGKYSGQKSMRRVYDTVSRLFLWVGITALAFTAIYAIAVNGLTSAITSVESVRRGVSSMRWAVIALPLLSAWAFVLDGIFIGLARTRTMFLTILAATAIFGVVASIPLLTAVSTPNAWLWAAFLSYLFARGVLLGINLSSKKFYLIFHL